MNCGFYVSTPTTKLVGILSFLLVNAVLNFGQKLNFQIYPVGMRTRMACKVSCLFPWFSITDSPGVLKKAFSSYTVFPILREHHKDIWLNCEIYIGLCLVVQCYTGT